MDFEIRKAALSETDQILSVIREVLSALAETEWFAADNEEFTRSLLFSENGHAYVAKETESEQIAGIFIVAYPGDSDDNLGLDAGLAGNELLKVAHMDSAAVLPAFRGHHLQKSLMEYAESDLKESGYRYLCCTIHPDNKFSLNSALSLGYHVVATCEKYGGYLRNVLMKEI